MAFKITKNLKLNSRDRALAKKEIVALARFKNLMRKNAGKLSFAGYSE
jgi:hypothetical protein